MNRIEFTEYIVSLNDFDLYHLSKNLLISGLMGSNIFEWKFELLQGESDKRPRDIYKYAVEDATLINTSRKSAKSEILIKEILRPSLMSMTSLSDNIENTSLVETDTGRLNTSDFLTEILSDDNDKYLLCRVRGDSMVDEGIIDDDILMVDREEQELDGKIIVAYLNDILFVKRYKSINGQRFLISANAKYKPYLVEDDSNFRVLGVVKYIMKNVE